jgi:hypothetical protein
LFVSIASAQEPAAKTPEEVRNQMAQKQAELKAEMAKMRVQLAPLLQHDAQSLLIAFKIKMFDTFDGCEVYSVDTFDELIYLGKVTDQLGSESIFNEYSQYGGEYSTESIWNQYGQYGGQYSSKSPFNPYTSSPPVIACNNKTVAFLTMNKHMRNAMDPWMLKLAFTM